MLSISISFYLSFVFPNYETGQYHLQTIVIYINTVNFEWIHFDVYRMRGQFDEIVLPFLLLYFLRLINYSKVKIHLSAYFCGSFTKVNNPKFSEFLQNKFLDFLHTLYIKKNCAVLWFERLKENDFSVKSYESKCLKWRQIRVSFNCWPF